MINVTFELVGGQTITAPFSKTEAEAIFEKFESGHTFNIYDEECNEYYIPCDKIRFISIENSKE